MRLVHAAAAAVLVSMVASFAATVWSLHNGHARWVVVACGVVVAAIIFLVNKAVRGTWKPW